MSICQFCGHEIEVKVSDAQVAAAAEKIIQECAIEHGVSVSAIRGRWRKGHIVAARHCAAVRLRYELDLTLKAVGLLLGRRDHSTIVSALQKFETHPCCSAGYQLGLPRVQAIA